MSDLSDYLENKLLDHVLRNSAYTPPAAVYVGLYTVAPTDAAGGTEVSGSGYAREVVTFGSAASGGTIANTAAVAFTAAGGDFGDIVAIGVFDAASAGNLLLWKAVPATTINDGDTANFPIGDIDVTLA